MSNQNKISEITISDKNMGQIEEELSKLEQSEQEAYENPYFSKEAFEKTGSVRDELSDIYILDDITVDPVMESKYIGDELGSDVDPFDFALRHYVEVKKIKEEKISEPIKKEEKERYNKKKKKGLKKIKPKINTNDDPYNDFF
uniref:Uncharacterized protein n=1 Tax=viral metagenome TaxID=1070528 RepID=A0A6C0ACC5_9ZZZZ